MKKIITVFLIASALFTQLFSFSSCSDNTKETEQDTTADTAVKEEITETELTANLPKANYNGHTIMHLTAENYTDNFRLIPELTAEPLDDAGFYRNLAVSEALNVKFDSYEVNTTQIASTLTNAIASGDTTYDFVLPHARIGLTAMVSEGLLVDLHTLPTVDFTKPWWNNRMMEELSLNNAAYYTSGDIVMTWQGMSAILFNKDYLTNMGINEDLYQVVRDGKWTLDKMLSLSSLAGHDLNGDGRITDADQFGYLGPKDIGFSYIVASAQPFTDQNDDGYPRLALNTERMIGIVEKYYALVNATSTWLDGYTNDSYPNSTYRHILIEGRSFLTELDIGGLYTYLREIEFDFGIMPLPKYDETQEHHQVFCGAGLIAVPSNLTDPNRTGAVAEALAFYSYKHIRPVFFDIVLENKAVRDQDSYEMITMMHESKTFEFGYNMGENLYSILDEIVINRNSTDFASYYESIESEANEAFKVLFDSIQ